MTLRLLFALALLPLAACADADDPVVVDSETDIVTVDPVDDPMMDDTMMDDTTMTDPMMDDAASDVTAQGTLDAAQAAGGLTSLAPAAAVENIDAWIAKLDGNAAAAPIVEGLQTLKGQLTATPLDGAAIGATLVELGTGTTAAAGGDTSLEQLGEALTSAGNTLQGN